MAGGYVLNQSEVDALLSAIGEGDANMLAEEAVASQVAAYDFKRPERVARDQLRAIETLHEVFARNLQAILSASLRTIIELKIANVDQLTYAEFINLLPNPTCFNVISCEPLEGSLILEINPSIAFPIFERLLGHSGKASLTHPERSLTEIEWQLIQKIIDRSLDLLKEVWASVVKMQLKVTGQESNPQLMPIMSSNEPVVCVTVEMTMGEHKGYINICIPVLSIEPVMDKITTHTLFHKKRTDTPGQEATILMSLSRALVPVSSYLAETDMTLKKLLDMKPGDIIQTKIPTTAPSILVVAGKINYLSRPGTFKKHRAVKIFSKAPF